MVRCGDDDDGVLYAVPEVALDKFPHLSAPLAYQPYYIHVGLSVAGNHTHEDTLSYTGPCKNSDSLAFPACKQAIHAPYSEIERLGDAFLKHGVNGLPVDRD